MPHCGATFYESNLLLGGASDSGREAPQALGWFVVRESVPTPALRDRVKSSQDFTFAPPLKWRGSSKEL